jgi:Ion channel
MIRMVEGAAGLLVVIAVLLDVFQSVVTPRPTAGRFRLARYINRSLWALTRWVALRGPLLSRREALLGSFGPAVVLVQLTVWILLLVCGYGLILDGLRDQIRPHPPDYLTSMYLAGTSLTTIGFGDYVATTALARGVTLAAGATGLGVVALVVTFLFSLYGAFNRREVEVVALEAAAGAPPSGVALLESFGMAGVMGDLPQLFQSWQRWSAEVLDTHLAYPVLTYFRSSHDNDSWIGSLGAIMDAGTLMLTTVDYEGDPLLRACKGWARLSMAVGGHCIEDLTIAFGLDDGRYVGVELEEYREARSRLERVGYPLHPEAEAWAAFQDIRADYAGRINELARHFVIPPALWIGDRSPLRHHTGHPERDQSPEPLAGVSRR